MDEAINLAFQAPSLSLPIIIGFGLLDSINPCVIGVLLVMLTVLLKTGDKRKILTRGISYVAGVYIIYLLGGITLLSIFNAIRSIEFISRLLYVVIGTFVFIAGILEIKDYFWYGRWLTLSIPKRFINLIESKVQTTHSSLYAAFIFGGLITLVELPCTGAPYLAILTLMSQGGFAFIKSFPLLLLYNLVFVIPLLFIIWLVYSGFGIKRLESWKKDHRGSMRLGIGVALLVVGIWIITAVADYLLIPLLVFAGGVFLLMWFAKFVLHLGQDWKA
jgi:cytochrome c biogenesis protein CcdA